MAEAWGAILNFLGHILDGIYKVIPSYGLAIIILTLLVRVVLIPLTVKQIRSMAAMNKLQPELKRLQQKYKGDRQKLNEEMMKLYREHGVNPLGGCFPLLMQAPVFIALYSVLRSSVPFDVVLASPVPVTSQLKSRTTICAPVGKASIGGPGFTQIQCTSEDKVIGPFDVRQATEHKRSNTRETIPSTVTRCSGRGLGPVLDPANSKLITGFVCATPGGTGHLPRGGKLFRAIVEEKATFLGMHLACSPTQATNRTASRECTTHGKAGGGALVVYFSLVLLMMASTFYQQKQMMQNATGPQAKQMQMMSRIMPLILGFVSLNIPAGVIIYWVVSNVWTIGQQSYFLKRQPAVPGGSDPGKGKPPTKPAQKPKPKPKR